MTGDSINSKSGLVLCPIPGGSFTMGPLEPDRECCLLEHSRSINLSNGFHITCTPITNGQFKQFITESGYRPYIGHIDIWMNEWRKGEEFLDYLNGGDNRPVVGVTFTEAQSYADWLTIKLGVTARLPTEAEFEYAAKAGCNCTNFCMSAKKIRNLVRQYGDSPLLYPPEVGLTAKNSFGVQDMNGIVWQWCTDWYWYYPKENQDNPHGPENEPGFAPWKGERWASGRVIRGGSFAYDILHSRCYSRHYSKENDRNFNLGFRVVIELPPEKPAY